LDVCDLLAESGLLFTSVLDISGFLVLSEGWLDIPKAPLVDKMMVKRAKVFIMSPQELVLDEICICCSRINALQ
ncbi:MAG: hypothetical protein K0T99_01325, partial [Alphaproteobacteria bacterium]|nr:hypothetical protein [Alphaproteobacteria bacterium]